MRSPSLLEFDWQLPPGVHAACTTRLGGVSAAPCDSFNLAMHVGDDPAHVASNRARLRELLALERDPAWLDQVHGIDVADLDSHLEAVRPTTADASVTSRRGVACVVMVADCLPVLFTSRDGSRVAAAHAGWRGLAAGVIERTVAAMGLPGSELRAWLGPCISRPHFEVGEEVRAAFVRQEARDAAFFDQNQRGHWQADLPMLARRRLHDLGVAEVSGGNRCTFADRQRCFSHRRDGRSGRIAALIWRSSP